MEDIVQQWLVDYFKYTGSRSPTSKMYRFREVISSNPQNPTEKIWQNIMELYHANTVPEGMSEALVCMLTGFKCADELLPIIKDSVCSLNTDKQFSEVFSATLHGVTLTIPLFVLDVWETFIHRKVKDSDNPNDIFYFFDQFPTKEKLKARKIEERIPRRLGALFHILQVNDCIMEMFRYDRADMLEAVIDISPDHHQFITHQILRAFPTFCLLDSPNVVRVILKKGLSMNPLLMRWLMHDMTAASGEKVIRAHMNASSIRVYDTEPFEPIGNCEDVLSLIDMVMQEFPTAEEFLFQGKKKPKCWVRFLAQCLGNVSVDPYDVFLCDLYNRVCKDAGSMVVDDSPVWNHIIISIIDECSFIYREETAQIYSKTRERKVVEYRGWHTGWTLDSRGALLRFFSSMEGGEEQLKQLMESSHQLSRFDWEEVKEHLEREHNVKRRKSVRSCE